MFVPFQTLPDHSRLWIYTSNKKFSSTEIEILSEALRAFTEQWLVHGEPMKASFDIVDNRFVLLAADEGYNAASGCSIDGSVRTLKALGEQLNADFFDRAQVAFRIHDEVVTIPLGDLKRKFEEGLWTAETLFFNTLVDKKGNLSSQWLTPAGSSWLKRYLPKETISG
ncbi:hypothetical protein [Chryseolinea lacunae]|uniref:ABC transporter ATPase n=1 Tax=Chryseolinea lacunae TaxID=2801331 RepID=A0ABS1KQY6_9BACT|nr:hypothetical protein [Chryseolinea lacunae]MBL0741856.1 hypothetical protein [Chryseolinea lacunae]